MVAAMERAGESPQIVAGAKAVGDALQILQKSIAQLTQRMGAQAVGSDKRTD